ncbi:MAG: hypothetical protein QF890_07420 [Myxococcota bacterium]|jgi:hypothetical protein|nr:hypothetical protein [Deltaproteobacteria bacterium]MCP4241938.1 hypothetical protein [bacterium]MDP7076476.1 hypothetical protein [Myxococcota bacterium]MDP7298774.1 hypothetical protein [Myxococcota bacterium]MDP7432386.1 hypothetical protein [Myxococcota bacterium]
MRHIEEQKAQLKNKLFQMRLYEVALVAPLGGALYFLTFGWRHAAELDGGAPIVLLGSGGLILVAAFFHWLNWRCPVCRKHLGNVLNPKYCSKCRAVFP